MKKIAMYAVVAIVLFMSTGVYGQARIDILKDAYKKHEVEKEAIRGRMMEREIADKEIQHMAQVARDYESQVKVLEEENKELRRQLDKKENALAIIKEREKSE